ALVGLRRLEADEGAPRPLPGLRRDEVRGVQDAADARQGRRLQPLTLKVPGDRGRPVVEAVSLQLTAQLPDALANTLLDGPSVTPGLPGARLDRLDATLAITREEHVHPLPGDAVTTSRLAWSQRTVDDRKDDDQSSPVAFGLSLLLQVRRPVGGHAAMLVTSSSLALGAASSSLLMSR